MDVSKIQGPGEHTPGPWEVWSDEKARREDVYIAGNPTGAIGGMRHLAYMLVTSSGKQIEANARLMAAAPDLLAAMPTIGHPGGHLVSVVAHYEDGSTQTIDGDVITAAIAKATGSAA